MTNPDTVGRLDEAIGTLEAHGIDRATLPGIVGFEKVLARLARLEAERHAYVPALEARRDAATRAWASGAGTFEAVASAERDLAEARDPEHTRLLTFRVDDARAALGDDAVDALAGAEAKWLGIIWPAIDAKLDVLRALTRGTVALVERWAAAEYGAPVGELSEHYHLELSESVNPLAANLDARAAYANARSLYAAAAQLRAHGVLPGATAHVPPLAWEWKATPSELDGIPGDGALTLEGAVLAMSRGIEPALNSLAQVEALNTGSETER